MVAKSTKPVSFLGEQAMDNQQLIQLEPQSSNQAGGQTITSLEIAEITGKGHAHLLRDIRNMEPAWEKITQSKFGLSTYKDSTGRILPCYALTKTECLYIATKFNDEARARLVLRWEQLETQRLANLPDFGNPAAAARAWAEQYEKNQQLTHENTILIGKIEQKDEEIEKFKADNAELINQLDIKDEDIKELRDELRKKNNVAAIAYLFDNDSTELFTWKEASDVFFQFTSFNVLLEYLKYKKWISDASGVWSPLSPYIGTEENGGVGYMEYYRPFHYEGDKMVYSQTLKLTRKGALAAKFLYDKDVRLGNINIKQKHLYKKDGARCAVLSKQVTKEKASLSPYGIKWE